MTTTNPSYSNYFRRRTIGRASSPPTFACYEQRGNPYDDEDDYSDECSEDEVSCSEDGEDYVHHASDSENEDHVESPSGEKLIDNDDLDMEMDDDHDGAAAAKAAAYRKDVKGKQRAIDPEPESPKRQPRQKKPRQPVYTLRPILTIQRSQGFVWNQDLFVPPYIKDRYAFSTSPPNASGFISTSASSTNSALDNYEVEVVEIRVNEGDLNDLIPA